MVTDTNWLERMFRRIAAGSREDILNGIKSTRPDLRLCAILAGLDYHERSPEFIEGLLATKDSPYIEMGWRLGEVAKAALDICGVEKYQGDDSVALKLIACKDEPPRERDDKLLIPTCERFEEWKDSIRAYCEENGLSFEKARQMGKSYSKDMLALVCSDRTKLPSSFIRKNIPLPAVLYITRTENGLQFKQTEYTQQILAP